MCVRALGRSGPFLGTNREPSHRLSPVKTGGGWRDGARNAKIGVGILRKLGAERRPGLGVGPQHCSNSFNGRHGGVARIGVNYRLGCVVPGAGLVENSSSSVEGGEGVKENGAELNGNGSTSNLDGKVSETVGEPGAPGGVDDLDDSQTLRRFQITTFFALLVLGVIFAALTLFFTKDIAFKKAVLKICKRLFNSVAARQTLAIVSAMIFVRFGLTPMVKLLRGLFALKSAWETSTEYYLLRELYQPLELLLAVAAISTLAENLLPPIIAVPKDVIGTVVRTVLSLTFILSAAKVTFTFKSRIFREAKWRLELKGELKEQRNAEAMDKFITIATVLVTVVLCLNAVGLDINSVLAIGGVGGLAIGLAGREIFENLFSGVLIMGSRPFDVGDEVIFYPGGKTVEGIVLDIGWYRTTIRSFEREVFVIPNSVFSRTVVLNVTRKQREFRFYEFIPLRVQDIGKVEAVVADMRRILRQDPRIIQKLHRRVFLDKLSKDYIHIYCSFYIEAANRDAFMAARQNLFLAFVDCVKRNGARLAENKIMMEIEPTAQHKLLPQKAVDDATVVDMMDSDDTETTRVAGPASAVVDGSALVHRLSENTDIVRKVVSLDESANFENKLSNFFDDYPPGIAA